MNFLKLASFAGSPYSKGPGGYELELEEAMNWFPELDEAPDSFRMTPHTGCSVQLKCEGLSFWVHNVELSTEAGFFFGDIKQWDHHPDNTYSLGPGQNIGFESRHVFDVQAMVIKG